MAGADVWVYNAEIFCVSFFNQVAFIFHLRGGAGESKKVFFGLHNDYMCSETDFTQGIKSIKNALTPHNEIRCFLSIKESYSNAKMDHHVYICLQ